MKKGVALLLALCMLSVPGIVSLAETQVFSFTITEPDGSGELTIPEDGLLDENDTDDANPDLKIKVQAEHYQKNKWSNQSPVFTLSLGDQKTKLPDGYSYAYARTMDGEIEIFTISGNVYQPYEDGEYKLQFLVLNPKGERAAADQKLYELKLDFTPPSLLVRVVNSASMNVIANDLCSGIAGVTVMDTAPVNPAIAADGTYSFSQTADKSISYPDGAIVARDQAGNTTANNATVSLYVMGISGMGGMGGMGGGRFGGGSGGTRRTVYHSASDSSSMRAYNAIELNVQQESMTRLRVGDEEMDLELYHNPFLVTEEPERREPGSFSARFGKWNGASSDALDSLLLIADEEEASSTWVFTGKVYKKLAASGIDYLLFQRGDRVAAISTAGFTAGIRYSMYRSAGLGSGEFAYAISMDDAGLEMNVTVDGQTYPLTQDPDSEFYYYDVFSGTMDQLNFSEG